MLLIVLLFIIFLCRLPYIKHTNRLLVLALLLAMSGKTMFVLYRIPLANGTPMLGPLPSHIGIYATGFFFLVFILKGMHYSLKKYNAFLLIMIPFLLVEYFIREGTYKNAFWPPVILFSQLFLFITIISQNFSKKNIFEALYENARIWMILELILTLCYPILGMSSVLTLFDDSALEQSARRAGYASAVGTFGHPAGLAFFCAVMGMVFFLAYLNNYKKRESRKFLLLSLFVIFFTYARTVYILMGVSLFLLYYFHKNDKITWKVVCYIVGGVFSVLLILQIPFFHKIFFESDLDDMYDARAVHWLAAFEMYAKNPLLGCGINTDVYYMYTQMPVLPEFIKTNPIHNVHLIVLTETGLVGLILWLLGHLFLIRYCYTRLATRDNYQRFGYVLCIAIITFAFVYNFTGWVFLGALHTPVLITSLLLLGKRKHLYLDKS